MRILFLLPVLILFAGCNRENRAELPPGLVSDSIIPQDEMIRMLAEVHLLEAALQMQASKGKNVQRMRDYYYDSLFSKYHTSEKRFTANLDYYEQNPEKLSKMYEQVVSRLDSLDKPPAKK